MALLAIAGSLAFLAPALGAVAAEPEKETDAVSAEIRTRDATEADAMLAADLRTLSRIWSDRFAVNSPDNSIKSKSQVLDAVQDGRIRYTSFRRTVERVAVHGDFAVSMGGEAVVPKGERPDAGQPRMRRYTHVWQRSGSDWTLVARHANWIPGEAR